MRDILAAAGGVLIAMLGFAGVRLSSRTARQASEQSTAVDAQANAIAAWEHLLEPYRAEVATLREEIAQLRTQVEAQSSWRHLAVTYIHTLRAALRSAGINLPAPPPNFDID